MQKVYDDILNIQTAKQHEKHKESHLITVTGMNVVCNLHHKPPPWLWFQSLPWELLHARWSIVTPMGTEGEAEKQAWSHLPPGPRRSPPTSTLNSHIYPHREAVRHLKQSAQINSQTFRE